MQALNLHEQDVGLKVHVRGTERTDTPDNTLERLRDMLPAMGITRVANVTGLDKIGIPVVMACRPNSRSLSVFQGKGVDLNAARVSGVNDSPRAWAKALSSAVANLS